MENINEYLIKLMSDQQKEMYINIGENYLNLLEKILLIPLFEATLQSMSSKELSLIYIDRVNICMKIIKEKLLGEK